MRRVALGWVAVGLMLTGCPNSSGDGDGGLDGGPRADGSLDQGRGDGAIRDGAVADGTVRDAAPPPDAAGDAGVAEPDGEAASPDPRTAAPPIFDPAGVSPADAPLAALVDVWRARPEDEAGAQAQTRDAEAARRTLAELGPVAADRVVERCVGISLHLTHDQLICFRLLSLVESPNSLNFLNEKAHLVVPPWPEGAHPIDPPVEGLARQVATWALGQRAKAGSRGALDLLLRLVAEPENANRAQAVQQVYGAMPRSRAKARMRDLLPAGELYRLYETR